jgi:hypothetical protein
MAHKPKGLKRNPILLITIKKVTMTKLQSASLTRFQALVLFFSGTDIVAIIANFLKLKDKVKSFVDDIAKIEQTNVDIGKVTKATAGSTKIRNKDIANMKKMLLKVCQTGNSWGVNSTIKDVQSVFALNATSFKIGKLDQIALAENALKVIQDNSATIIDNTDISAKTIAALVAAVAKAVSHKGELRNQIVLNKVNTADLKKQFSDTNKKLVDITASIDGLFSEGMPDANPEFLDAFKSVAALEITSNPTGVEVTFLDGSNNNKPLPDALLSIVAYDKSVPSGPEGVGLLKKIRAKKGVTLTLSCEGFETQTRIVDIRRGIIIKITVVMQKSS